VSSRQAGTGAKKIAKKEGDVNLLKENRHRYRNWGRKETRDRGEGEGDEGLRTREPCELTVPSIRKLQLFGPALCLSHNFDNFHQT
jgi:hypothetical protein